MKLNNFIDHTILKATATKEDILQLCEEAKNINFFCLCKLVLGFLSERSLKRI